MFFAWLLALTTLFIAGCAAYFSIDGLSQLFVAAPISVMVMGVSLEAGKLMAASFLYRLWSKISIFIKTYLILAIIVLMCITSIGIFGYLSAAYQTGSVDFKAEQSHKEALLKERDSLDDRLKQINIQIEKVPDKYVSKRVELMNNFKQEKSKLVDRIESIDAEVLNISGSEIKNEAKIGPIIYVAKALNVSIDHAIILFVLLIMVVFDPLAVVLTISSNKAFEESRKAKIVKEEVVIPEEKIIEIPADNNLHEIKNKLNKIHTQRDLMRSIE